MTPRGILETVLYARDLGAIEDFYRRALGLEPFAKAEGRHVFYRVEPQALSPLAGWMDRHRAFWPQRIDRLKDVLKGMDQ